MSAPGTPKASEAAVAAVQDALGPCKQSGTSPNGFDTPVCLTHCEYWTERGCPVAVAAADAAAPHIAAQTLRDAARSAGRGVPMSATRTPVEVTTRYATTVHTLTDAWAFVMARIDTVGGHPRVAITPFTTAEDEQAFEVVVEGMTEQEGE